MLRNAKRNAKLVETGEISIGEETKWNLSSEERRSLDQITANIREASSQLETSRSQPGVEVVLRDIATSCVRLEAEQDSLSQRLAQTVRQLHTRVHAPGATHFHSAQCAPQCWVAGVMCGQWLNGAARQLGVGCAIV